MPTTYSDQFYYLDPANPPGSGTSVSVNTNSYVDGNDNGDIDDSRADTWEGVTITRVYRGDVITVRYGDGVEHTITGVTFYLADGQRVFTPTDGTVLEDATYVRTVSFVPGSTEVPVGDFGPPCFTPGTLIDTATGPRPVEDIAVGDMIWTLDRGLQPVRWIGQRTVVGADNFAPVMVRAGALGNSCDLLVSPQHRFLLSDWRAELMTGETEVLVSARYLVNGRDIVVMPCAKVTYLHIMFDHHEIIFAEGAPTESFFAGGVLAQGMVDTRDELMALFPELIGITGPGQTIARPAVKRFEAAAMVA